MRLMYVEDNQVNALLFEEALRSQPGIELRIAEDGAQALALARQWQPQVLVLDSHLPDTDGLRLLGQLRALPGLADAPVFICSADAMPEDIQRAQTHGIAGYWTKPIRLATVFADLQRVRAALAGR